MRRRGYVYQSRKPLWQWTNEDHRLAAEAHHRAQGAAFLKQHARGLGALWNSRGPGYGGGKWPFDARKAIKEVGYRTGVERASRNPHYDSVWREHAKWLLTSEVYPILDSLDRELDALFWEDWQ